MRSYHTPQGRVLGLRPYRYLYVVEGERRRLTFYAETREEADRSARGWAHDRGKIYRIRKKKGTTA